MRRRLLCLLLAAVMLLGITPVVSLPIRAASNLSTSDALIEVLKKLEGFISIPREDNGQYSVGYGSGCGSKYEDVPVEYWNGISEEKAEELLRNYILGFEASLNAFIDKHGLIVSQQQFDALISLTYNLGSGWMVNYKDKYTTLYNAVSSGDTGAFLAYAVGLYKTSSGTVSKGHIYRRMVELQIYFHGIYGAKNGYDYKNWPEKVRYVLLDGNGGSIPNGIQAFDINHPTGILETVTPPEGYEFAGWYTQREGGIQITELNESIPRGMELYAHWKNAAGEIVTLQGDSLTYTDVNVDVVVNYWDIPIYAGPGDYYYEVRRMTGEEQVHITKVTTGKDGNLFGLCADGWVKLSQTNYATVVPDTPPDTEGDNWYKVTTPGGLNVRTGPGVSYDVLQEKFKISGTRIQLVSTEAEANSTRVWGKMEDGNWICIKEDGVDYVAPDPSQVGSSGGSSQTPITGNTVTGLTLISAPNKTQYELNGKWTFPDLTGGQIKIHYGPSTYRDKVVSITQSMVSGFDNSTLGTKTITVTCSGYTTTFNIEIIPSTVTAIEIQTKPTKTEYLYQSEALNVTGGVLLVTYGEGITREVPITAEMVTGFNNTVLGTNTLTVTYGGFTATFDVTIINPVVTFLNYDGTVISQTQYAIGAAVSIPEDPYKPADKMGEYVFTGWDKTVVACAGNATYTATFKLRYAIGDLDRNDSVDGNDAIYLLRHVLYPEKYTIHAWADFVADDQITEADAIYLLRHVLYPEKYPLQAE